MRILLTGKDGQLGWELRQRLEQRYDIIALGRDDLDLRDTRYLHDMLKRLPELTLIVNGAAYTDVDKAEHEPQVAELVNAEAPAILAAEAERRNIPIIHLSTSYVFDGKDQTEPYTENDHTNPLSVYGRSKLSGEQRVRDLCDRHLIFRLSSIYGIRRRNFLTTMLKYLHQSEAPHVVDDQIVSPTWCPIIADAMESVILRLLKKSQVPWGIYHFCSSGAVSCHEFACEIFKLLSATHGIPTPVPHPVTSQEFNAKALRPAYSILNSQEFITTFAYPILSWKTQLIHCMNTLRPENMDAIIGSPHWRKMK